MLSAYASALPKRVLQRGNLKREQSFDSLFWELKSNSPRYDFLPNLDNLKRQPMSLSTAGSVWDRTKGRLTGGILRPSDPLNMQPKPKLAKHKFITKQKSQRIDNSDSPAENQNETVTDQEQKCPAVADSTVCANYIILTEVHGSSS
ncbi:putative RNA-directed DNA polymerase from transposon X-element [Trichonephila inaurata madagascariensis]|uniref:Putative RNA-directed DNA polymerase from transposon X-element n=1 Tax=Trichonephila inaurata madagascariensis TaxID=2747483 RepID=A0A8X6WM22_9ARAC|nr:putative RNA-directed DNA polymerase from transposon X-element [Trichonephila inaurata madagascariensis]